MGLFDGFKDAFSNDPRLEKDRNVNAGKSKNTPGYVKKKEQERKGSSAWQQQNKQVQDKKGEGQGDRTLGELFEGWKW